VKKFKLGVIGYPIYHYFNKLELELNELELELDLDAKRGHRLENSDTVSFCCHFVLQSPPSSEKGLTGNKVRWVPIHIMNRRFFKPFTMVFLMSLYST
jgi:hypothetical protein